MQMKIRFFHGRWGPNIGHEPHFHDTTTLNDKDYPGSRILTLMLYGSPPKNRNSKMVEFTIYVKMARQDCEL